jgi:Tfp pilus assembly protein PilN
MQGSKGLSPRPATSWNSAWRGGRGKSGIGSISAPRWRMTPMVGLLVAWGILTTILVVLMIYKSTLTMHEDDSIFLNETESQMEKDQVEILAKVNKITPMIKVLGAISGLMILVIAGMFVYDGLMRASTPQ